MNVNVLNKATRFLLGRLTLVSVAFLSVFTMTAQAQDDEALEEIVVKGIRGSLSAALDFKRNSTGQVDAIIADDIADFPDTNLAEALQRIPGVAITRLNGEGQNITVRGLSGLYTRTRINGMEARAGFAGNTTRNFDFNLFAAELFNSVVIQKTPNAATDEGSLGATVDLNTGRPFNYQKGQTVLLSGQAWYNDQSEDAGPRLTGLYAYNDPEGKWGFSASAAYSEVTTQTNRSDTVRWQRANFNSVLGVDCGANPGDAGCTEVSQAFHARIPRYATDDDQRDRIGLTMGLQFRPTDQTEISIDAMYADYQRVRDFYTIEVLFRGNEGGMDVTGYEIQPFPDRYGDVNDTVIAMDVDNAWVRSEAYHQEVESDFTQITAQIEHSFSDRFSITGLIGTNSAKDHMPVVTTLMYDDRDYDGYTYDYSQSMDRPVLAFNGPDVTDGTIFTLTELRDQVHTTENDFDNATLSGQWEFTPAAVLSGGVSYKKFTFKTRQDRRDGSACRPGLFNCDLDGDGVNDVLGPQGTDALSQSVSFGGDVGAGSTTVWAAPSIPGWTSALNFYDFPLSIDQGRHRDVEETNLGVFLQLSGQVPVGDMSLMYDVGARYVETDQTSSGYNSGIWVSVDRPKYSDTLPSANAALWVTDSLVFRSSIAEVMSRPALGNLSPGGSVDSFNYAINFQNPNLDPTRADIFDVAVEWYFAEDSVLSFAYFTKDIESFPIRDLTTGTFASTGLPTSVIAPTSPASQDLEGTCGNPEGCWEISQLVNGPGADVDGYEIAFQTPFSTWLNDVPVLSSMGIVLNYTYVDSTVSYNYNGNAITERLLGLSNDSYNATLYYETERFGARVSVAKRDDYLESGPDRSDNLWQFVDPSTYVDFSSTYRATENLSLTFEILNLTDEPFDSYVDVDARRRLDLQHTGVNWLLGARYQF